MHEDDSGAPDGFVSPCAHRNPPSARFCDVCGVRLPRQCPRCHAINRVQANFCNHCGSGLRDARRPSAEPSIVAFGSSPDSSAATASDSAPAPSPPPAPPRLAANEGIDGSEALDLLPWTEGSGPKPVADDSAEAERLEQMARFLQRRRRPRRALTWLGTVSVSLVLGLLGAALVRTYIATPRDVSPQFIDADARPPIAAPADGSVSASIAQSTPAGTGPPAPTVSSNSHGGSRGPAAPEGSPAFAPVAPRAGGTLTFVVPGEPPSYDAHREETFALIHPAAPHYNTLLRIDAADPTGTRVVGDLATSWTVSSDRRTYVLKLRRGVKFHDGSEMTSRDVRATYEKIINPPPGITSARRGEYLQIETVQAPEPYIVAFKLKWPSPSFVHSLASPWNWIYKAEILERDVRWYEKNIMGTGPFIFVEHVTGSHWAGRRNPEYWDRGKPYLDGYQALFLRDDTAQASVIRSGNAHMQFRGFSPAQRDDIVRGLGEKITVQESPWNCGLLVAINHEKEPFHDRRVRRALSLALDRYRAASSLSKTAIVREVAGVQVPGSPLATPPAELMKLAGYWRDIRESRSEARRLLAEAGIPDGFSFELKNRDIPMPYQHIGAWLVDEWRRIGLKVRHEVQDSSQYFKDLRAGNFELSTDFQCGYVVDPDLDLYKFQSRGRSDANYGRYADPVLDDLYVRQSRAVDPEQRRRYIRAFEKRLLDEEAHYIYTLQWHRIVPHSSRVRGWTITPSHYLNSQLDTVWLAAN
jgi:peptide/nickel transport system substrate-binding protein